MSTISTVNNYNINNSQITNKVAAVNSANLANNAANQSAFSSYIGQAFAQIGISNPTSLSAPVVSSTNKTSTKEQDSQKFASTFIQDLFSILSEKDVSQQLSSVDRENQSSSQHKNNDNEAINAYTEENSTTVGNIITNLQNFLDKLNANQVSKNDNSVQTLQNGFQRILEAQGATKSNTASLGKFLQTLAQNLQGQSPLGIIINTQA